MNSFIFMLFYSGLELKFKFTVKSTLTQSMFWKNTCCSVEGSTLWADVLMVYQFLFLTHDGSQCQWVIKDNLFILSYTVLLQSTTQDSTTLPTSSPTAEFTTVMSSTNPPSSSKPTTTTVMSSTTSHMNNSTPSTNTSSTTHTATPQPTTADNGASGLTSSLLVSLLAMLLCVLWFWTSNRSINVIQQLKLTQHRLKLQIQVDSCEPMFTITKVE